jgi:hypothetical protein
MTDQYLTESPGTTAAKARAKAATPTVEYAIWGIPTGETEEQLLFTHLPSLHKAQCAIDRVQHRATGLRIQTIDFFKTIKR